VSASDYGGWSWVRQSDEWQRNSMELFGSDFARQWGWYHTAMGDDKGLALYGFKQYAFIVWEGREMARYPTEAETGQEVTGGKYGEYDGWRFALKKVRYPHSSGLLMWLKAPDGREWAGIVGYGLEAGWVDYFTGAELDTDEGGYYAIPTDRIWLTEVEAKKFCLGWVAGLSHA
jgi:hypothetical protein